MFALRLPIVGGKWRTIIWAGSDSEGMSPPDLCETLDAGLRMSSRVLWKVSSDILMVVRLYYEPALGGLDLGRIGVSDRFRDLKKIELGF